MTTVRPLVALKCKVGELEALRNLRSENDAQVQLMIELLDSMKPGGDLLDAFVRAAVRMAEFGRSLWLDTTWLTSASPFTNQSETVFEQLEDLVRRTLRENYEHYAPRCRLTPVVSIEAADDELNDVHAAIDERDREVVVRIRGRTTPVAELAGRVRRIARSAGSQGHRVHAIIDLGFIQGVRDSGAAAVTESAKVLSELLGPESITLLSGSTPRSRTTYETIERARLEVSLWNAVRQGGAEEVGYGDYGVTHPDPPVTSRNSRNPHPYLCYTVPRKSVVLRRRPEAGDASAEAFADLAEELVDRPDFAGSGYSWGDEVLAQCRRRGERSAGSVSKWVAMATSHHIEHVSRRAASEL
jgi:hypothetical protein